MASSLRFPWHPASFLGLDRHGRLSCPADVTVVAARIARPGSEEPGAPFRMPIEVGIEVEGEAGPRTATIEVRSQRESLTLPLDKAPKAVTLDPRTWVLMDAEVVLARPAGRP